MQRLFLGSDGLGALRDFMGGNPAGLRVLFITTGADPVSDKSFMERDLEYLRGLALEIETFDLKGQTNAEIEDALKRADIVFVEGGSSDYLRAHAVASGDRVRRRVPGECRLQPRELRHGQLDMRFHGIRNLPASERGASDTAPVPGTGTKA